MVDSIGVNGPANLPAGSYDYPTLIALLEYALTATAGTDRASRVKAAVQGARIGPRDKIFDFMGPALPAGVTLVRASTGTRWNNAGALVTEAIDVARFDYHPVTHVCRGLLVEREAHNEVWYSQDLTMALPDPQPGNLYGMTYSSIAIVDATTIREHNDGSGNTPALQIQHATVVGQRLTVSVVASAYRPGGSSKRYLHFREIRFSVLKFPPAPQCAWDIEAGIVIDSNEHTTSASIEQVGPDSWRCSVSVELTVAQPYGIAHYNLYSSASTTSPPQPTFDEISGLHMTHLQLEQGVGAPVTSIIPTNGSAGATRKADVITLDLGSKGYADGPLQILCIFDDFTQKAVDLVIAAGHATVDAALFTSTRLRHIAAPVIPPPEDDEE